MLSDYRYRKLKRDEVKRSYQQLQKDKKWLSLDKLLLEWEAAFTALHGRKPLKAERPLGKSKVVKSTANLWAQVHTKELTNGLDD